MYLKSISQTRYFTAKQVFKESRSEDVPLRLAMLVIGRALSGKIITQIVFGYAIKYLVCEMLLKYM